MVEILRTHGCTVQKLPEGGWQVNLLPELGEDNHPDVYISLESNLLNSGISPLTPLRWQSRECQAHNICQDQRNYLHLRFANGEMETIADRVLALEGGFNFRDLGGYRTQTGQMVRWGTLYRSARLSRLTQQDQAYIRKLEIHTICDLRSSAEAEKDPTPGDLAKQMRHLPLNLSTNRGSRNTSHTDDVADQALVLSSVRDRYRAFTQSKEAHAEFFHILLDPESGPILFHCTAGKDRTGVTAALLLWALGVSWDFIVQDFEISNQFTNQLVQLIAPNDSEVDASHPLWPLTYAYPENLKAAIEAILAEYGNLDNFFLKGLQLGPGWKGALRDKYLLP